MKKGFEERYEEVEPDSVNAWRTWLEHNHGQSESIWLILAKKDSGLPSLKVDEAIDQAMCFGWVDSHIRGIDEQRYRLLFSPRNPKSNWSRVNKEKVARLMEQG